MNDDLSILWDV